MSRKVALSASSYSEERQQFKNDVVEWALHRIRQCNHVPTSFSKTLIDWVVEGQLVGQVRPSLAKQLCEQIDPNTKKPIFQLVETRENDPKTLENKVVLAMTDDTASVEERTNIVGSIMDQLRDDGVIQGWRDELYPVLPLQTGSSGTGGMQQLQSPLLLLERAAAPHMGIEQFGVHINGYVRIKNMQKNGGDGKDKIQMWMARRSQEKSKYPGMLDHVVAGGQPHDISPMDNVVKECYEEAGIPEDIAKQAAVPVGAVSYAYAKPLRGTTGNTFGTIDRSILFCYDLELPQNFVPQPVDGEVDEFFLWDLDQVAASLHPDYEDPIKPNCYLVIIDFLLRWGYITPESPGYLDVWRELHGGGGRL